MHTDLTRALRLFGLLEPGRRLELQLRMRQSRRLPDAVILGAQKCGTSSLHNYLTQHPQVIAPLRKEVHYFDDHHALGEGWYRAHFSLEDEPGLNLDSSPYYLFHPRVPQRLHALLPDAKLIVLLRDPVRRAYSHYWHERDAAREALSFEDAIERETERLGDDARRLATGELDHSRAHRIYSYLARGRYAEQLERWYALFPREQLLVQRFEDLAASPLATLNSTLHWLGLPRVSEARTEPRNARHYPPMEAPTQARLREYFAVHNARLEGLLGRGFGW